jgi:hypothetical protein
LVKFLKGSSSSLFQGRTASVKQVARELGARYLVEGSLRKTGNRARVAARLIETETGKYLWAEHYDRDVADIFAMQDEIICVPSNPGWSSCDCQIATADSRFDEIFLASDLPDQDPNAFPSCTVVLQQFDRLDQHHEQIDETRRTRVASPGF